MNSILRRGFRQVISLVVLVLLPAVAVLLLSQDVQPGAGTGTRPGRTIATNSASSVALQSKAVSNSVPALPALPAGVTDLALGELFKMPIGPRGMEYTEKAKLLDGAKVRLVGHMVRQEEALPGFFILSPRPVHTHDDEMGLADDLPGSIVYVHLPDSTPLPAYQPGLVLVTGKLLLGAHDETDGRVSWVRLELASPTAAESAPARPSPKS